MTEVLFYHLQAAPLESVLPQLVHKTLERGWRAVVQTTDEERLKVLSDTLWQWRDDEFLAHGSQPDNHGELQPIWLTVGSDTPNGASVRFLVNGADCDDPSGLDRLIVLFDGADDAALSQAREKWKSMCSQGFKATYWRQDDRGKWQKQAESGNAEEGQNGAAADE
jgi:DNA polymerase-3 subunit chi